MKKLQSFQIFKFSSDYLRNCNYNVKDLSLSQARLNNQVIRISDSELLRKIRRLRNSQYTPEKLSELLQLKGSILSHRDAKDNRKAVIDIENQIDELLWTDDLISVKFIDNRHYKRIVEKGLTVNGKQYVRLLCGAGMARANTVLFVNSEIFDELWDFINAGRDMSIKLNPQKFSAYSALASSATTRVHTPLFVVIPDMIVDQEILTDYISESPVGKDAIIESKLITIKKNVFDGQGILSVEMAQDWADGLDLQYLPSAYIYRAAYMKGLLVVTDFKKIAEENGVEEIIDIYDTKHNIFDIDAIISQSQFKMSDGYKSIEHFRKETKDRDFGWGVSRCTPKFDKDTAFLTYQYLQVLDLDDNGIEEICQDSLTWLQSVQYNPDWMKLFLLGELTKERLDLKWFNKFNDPIVKAILLNPDVCNDPHIISYVQRLTRKMRNETCMGTLRVPGNYSFLSCDPVAQVEHVLGLTPVGILKKGMIYSNYWNKKNVKEIAVLRSPTTWKSEIITAPLQKDEKTEDYFRYNYSNLIFSIYDNFLNQMAGADLDGDIALSTSVINKYVNKEYLTPSYERNVAAKKEIDVSKLYESDIASFNSKVGLLTNWASSLLSMLPLYEKDSVEYKTIIDRLKISNILQNQIIDGAKGVKIFPFPRWWSDKLSEDEKENLTFEEIELYNKLRIHQRPMFLKYVYPDKYGKAFRKHRETYNNMSRINLGKRLDDLFSIGGDTDEEKKLAGDFIKYSPLLDSPSVMNNLCRYAEDEISKIKDKSKKVVFDWKIYLDDSIELDKNKLGKMRTLYKEFASSKRNSNDTGRKSKEQKEENILVFRKKMYEISSDLSELTNLAVRIVYDEFPKRSRDFVWKILPHGILRNLDRTNVTRTVDLLVEKENGGEVNYLNKSYEHYTLEI
jgi:hypothetical protein